MSMLKKLANLFPVGKVFATWKKKIPEDTFFFSIIFGAFHNFFTEN